jgi:hypothetical protein
MGFVTCESASIDRISGSAPRAAPLEAMNPRREMLRMRGSLKEPATFLIDEVERRNDLLLDDGARPGPVVTGCGA